MLPRTSLRWPDSLFRQPAGDRGLSFYPRRSAPNSWEDGPQLPHFVYIIRCRDGTLYTGYTTDLEHRLRQHNGEISGGARYTRGRGPVTLAYREEHESMTEAMRREAAIKRLTHMEKESLAARGSQSPVAEGPLPPSEAVEGGTLLVCATPIGNLADVTLRVLDGLREADLVAAEDTRQTRKLLAHYDIHTPLTSYHEHNKRAKGPVIIEELSRGKRVALVSDAGMPGISDPGADIIAQALATGFRVEVLPGPSAALTALVLSGLPTDRFAFEGFLPRAGKERRRRLAEASADARTLIFYEAPHRLRVTLGDLLEVMGDRPVAVARELTKRFEEVQRGRLSELLERYATADPRGEFTLVVGGATAPAPGTGGDNGTASGGAGVAAALDDQELVRRVKTLEDQGLPRKDAMRRVAQESGLPRREVYRAVVAVMGDNTAL